MALKLKHKCPICERTFPTQRGMRIHQNHPKIPCEKGRPPASRKGSLADKLVNKAKKVKEAQAMPHVTLNEHQLENVLNFDYLGCRTSGDGDDKADMQQRMNIATAKCASLNKIWKDHRLPKKVKMGLYMRSVCMVFAHGSETWSMAPNIQRSINGFNSRCLHKITGCTYQSETTEPTYDRRARSSCCRPQCLEIRLVPF